MTTTQSRSLSFGHAGRTRVAQRSNLARGPASITPNDAAWSSLAEPGFALHERELAESPAGKATEDLARLMLFSTATSVAVVSGSAAPFDDFGPSSCAMLCSCGSRIKRGHRRARGQRRDGAADEQGGFADRRRGEPALPGYPIAHLRARGPD